MSALQNLVMLPGRILLSQIFILSAVNHVLKWGGMIAYMKSKGMGLESVFGNAGDAFVQIMLAGATAFMFFGGLAVLFGAYTSLGRSAAYPICHPRGLDLPQLLELRCCRSSSRPLQMANFLKNIGLAGGLLILLAVGPGSWSIDAFRRNRDDRKHPAPSP